MRLRGIIAVAVTALALAGALPARADMPERVEPLRQKWLTRARYVQLRDEWKAYAEAHPNDAHAWAQLARSAGYAGDGCAATLAYAEKAYRLDPDDPDACAELAKSRWSTWCPDQPSSPDEPIRLLEHALAVAPDQDDAHVRLWVLRLAKGDRRGAEAELRSLLDRGRIPEPLADYGYNELVGVEPNAIVFTNGDNDTYPAIALQVARGLRTDVSIVNLSMLNLVWYRRMLREAPNPVPVPLLDPAPEGWGGSEALHAVLDMVGKPGFDRPVYLAVTVALDAYGVKQPLSCEGTVYRVRPGTRPGTIADTARLERNLGTLYRLESATSPALDWGQFSSIGMLVRNYGNMDLQLALARARAGNKVGAGRAMERALRFCEFHHLETAGELLKQWRAFDPASRSLALWTKRLAK